MRPPPVRPGPPITTAWCVATLSGTRIAAIPAARAHMFLATFDEPVPAGTDLALGAFQDEHQLIGVGVLSDQGSALVAVHPGRRRLGVGTDLAHALLDEAATRHLGRLTGAPRRPSSATLAFLAALGVSIDGTRRAGLIVVPVMAPHRAT